MKVYHDELNEERKVGRPILTSSQCASVWTCRRPTTVLFLGPMLHTTTCLCVNIFGNFIRLNIYWKKRKLWNMMTSRNCVCVFKIMQTIFGSTTFVLWNDMIIFSSADMFFHVCWGINKQKKNLLNCLFNKISL